MTLYISKKCMDCNKLLVELNEEGLTGVFNIVLIEGSSIILSLIFNLPSSIKFKNLI